MARRLEGSRAWRDGSRQRTTLKLLERQRRRQARRGKQTARERNHADLA